MSVKNSSIQVIKVSSLNEPDIYSINGLTREHLSVINAILSSSGWGRAQDLHEAIAPALEKHEITHTNMKRQGIRVGP
jgi:hypothetical protein